MNVDVIYEGLALVKGANARAEGGGLFVEWEAPMPVGTRLDLVTPDGTRRGRVESVIEGVGAGMLVGFSGVPKTAEPNAPMQEMKSVPPIQVEPASQVAPAEADKDDEEPPGDKPPEDDDGGKKQKKGRRPRKTIIGH